MILVVLAALAGLSALVYQPAAAGAQASVNEVAGVHPSRPDRSVHFLAESSLLLGASSSLARGYHVWSNGDPAEDETDVHQAGLAAVVTGSLGVVLGRHIALAAFFGVGAAERTIEDPTRSDLTAVLEGGGQLTLSQRAFDGVYLRARLGVARFDEQVGWATGVGAGYGFKCRGGVCFGVGAELHALWSAEDSDGYVAFPFTRRMFIPGLVLRVQGPAVR